MSLSGIVVYFSPPSHIAGFSQWKFLSLGKNIWMALHVNSGVLFIIVFIFHTYYNLKPISKYIFPTKNKIKNFYPLIISVLIFFYLVAGTFLRLPPMFQILKIGKGFKARECLKYGTPPPYGVASSIPLKKISIFLGMPLNKSIAALKYSGIKTISPKMSIGEIAEKNHVTIGFLLDSMNNYSKLKSSK